MESVRIDKWLWAARLFKTRSLATTACSAGHVKVDGSSVKASRAVRRGEQIDVLTPGGPKIVDVIELSDKRGPASIAQTLYEDRTPPPPEIDPLVSNTPLLKTKGKPSKRDRRSLRKIRGY